MMLLQVVLNALNARKSRALKYAQAALSQSQFDAFRGLFLDEFGRNGLESELERIVADYERLNGKRCGQADTCRKGGAP